MSDQLSNNDHHDHEGLNREDDTVLRRLADADPVGEGDTPTGDSAKAQALVDSVVGDRQRFDPYQAAPPSSPRTRRWPMVAAVAAAVALLAGAVATLLPTNTEPALAVVQQAADDTEQVTSGRAVTSFQIDGRADGEDGSVAGTITTSFNGDDIAAALSIDQVPDQLSDQEPDGLPSGAETRYVDGTIYVSEDGEQWIATSAPPMMAESLVEFTDARVVLNMVADLTDVEEVGSEDLEVPTTRYRGTIDLTDEAVSASDWLPPAAGQAGDRLSGTVTIDIWVDDDGLLRRLGFEGDLAPNPDSDAAEDLGEDAGATYRVVTDFSDLGEDVPISIPDGPIETFQFDEGGTQFDLEGESAGS